MKVNKYICTEKGGDPLVCTDGKTNAQSYLGNKSNDGQLKAQDNMFGEFL